MILKTKDKILLMRRAMELSQKALGMATGIYYQRIWSWEKGLYSPPVDLYEKICELYEKKTGEKRPE